MTSPDDIERRLSGLERDVAELREQQAFASSDAAAGRTLAAGADRDVSEVRAELRAHTSVLNALRETQLEQGQLLAEHSRRFIGLDGRLVDVDSRLHGVDGRLADVDGRLHGVDGRLDGLETKIDQHAAQTAAGFATVHAGMDRIAALLTDRES